jgi:cell division protein FtsA
MKRVKGAPDRIIVGIDVGTTKVCVIVAQSLGHGQLEILGIGKALAEGMARGMIVDIALAIHSIKSAVKEAEIMSGVAIESAYIGISGSHIQGVNSEGVVAIKQREVRSTDIAQVLAAAKAIPLPEGHQILHAIPRGYTVDGQQHVRDPQGMYGVRLESKVHIITGSIAAVQNLVRCCHMAGVKVRDIVLEPLASAEAVLSDDEKELGAFLLDIGGGTADFAFYQQGAVQYTRVIPIGGDLFTQDIALCFRTTIRDAERVKKEFGYAHPGLVDEPGSIEVELVQGGRTEPLLATDLATVIQARTEELFEFVRHDIAAHALEGPAGLVLTGGGALLPGIASIAEHILNKPVRVGKPKAVVEFKETLDSPIYSTAYGLLLHVLKTRKVSALEVLDGPLAVRLFTRMRLWISDFF